MTDFIQTVLSPLVGDAVQPLHTSNYFLIRKLFRACNSCAVCCQAPGVKSSKIDIKIYSSNFFKCSHTRLTCWGHIRSNNNPSAPESGLICFFALELINLKNVLLSTTISWKNIIWPVEKLSNIGLSFALSWNFVPSLQVIKLKSKLNDATLQPHIMVF